MVDFRSNIPIIINLNTFNRVELKYLKNKGHSDLKYEYA